jgi:hypothetical protein
MTKFNKPGTRTATKSPVASARKVGLTTGEGAPGFKRDAKGELFVLAVGRFFGEKTFYEKPDAGAQRFVTLIHEVASADPAWTAAFLKWLRTEANIRTSAIVGAVEYARTLQALASARGSALPLFESQTARTVVRSVLRRADEPGEMIAYCRATYGRSIPIAVKRGIADAICGYFPEQSDDDIPETARRGPLYTQYSLLKYDTPSHGYRFGDVVDTVCPATAHPDVRDTHTGDLFEFAINRRHGRESIDPELFPLLAKNSQYRRLVGSNPNLLLDVEKLRAAGLTWEDALSLGGDKIDKRKLWEALIDAEALGYTALIRNLRNFDEAGVSKAHAKKVAEIIEDEARVKSSRQLPFRFLSAYHTAPSDRWKQALTEALDYSTSNIPKLSGRTLVLVDTSGSMESYLSGHSKVRYVVVAALFGVALARNASKVDLYGFGDGVFRHELAYGGSVLGQTQQFVRRVGEAGHGTQIAASMKATFAKHDRVVIFTDMQTMSRNAYTFGYGIGNVSEAVPANVPVYAWNLAGYEASMMPTGSGNRHEFGGFSDSAFSIMQTLEAGRDGRWPWQ